MTDEQEEYGTIGQGPSLGRLPAGKGMVRAAWSQMSQQGKFKGIILFSSSTLNTSDQQMYVEVKFGGEGIPKPSNSQIPAGCSTT